jgi:phosphoribosylformylglycinamidine synthase
VLIPVFPGTTGEYESAGAFERAGGEVETAVLRSLAPDALSESLAYLEKKIRDTQIIMLPGGFSAGGEPADSSRCMAIFLKNPRIADAVFDLIENRDGLILGIGAGFKALMKTGLLPYGKYSEMTGNSPAFALNAIGAHQSTMVTTRIASDKSPWFAKCEVGALHTLAVSYGEGRFVAAAGLIRELAENGQIAAQYVDLNGEPSMDVRFNPFGSADAVESVTSPDGRVLGKMGHSERTGKNIAKNIPGEKEQGLFESGIGYYI